MSCSKLIWVKIYKVLKFGLMSRRRTLEAVPTITELSAKRESKPKVKRSHADSGQELDMKGRCSMGQKVLASLIIRMAMAEAFCTECEIFALDEPTTNLDADHCKSIAGFAHLDNFCLELAKQIGKLIEARNGDCQFIVITHDIHFVEALREYADSYYHVEKVLNA
jgi:DNA repair protein RAD50